MISVTQKARWCHRFLKRIEKAQKKGDKHAVSRISGYWRVPVKSAYDWFYKWDGTWQSLQPGSHRPHGHPKAHTDKEIQKMITVTRECGFLAPLLMYQELVERGYTRSYGGFKRFFRKHFAAPTAPLVNPKKPQVYDGGTFPGERVQIDVKYVPKVCLYGEKLYQYTLVDEYSRWCYREIHAEHSAYISGLFIRRAVKAAPFKIKMAQTDSSPTPCSGKRKRSPHVLRWHLRSLASHIEGFVSEHQSITEELSVNTAWICSGSISVKSLPR